MLKEQQRYFFPCQLLFDCLSIAIAYCLSAPLSLCFIAASDGLLPAPPEAPFPGVALPFYWDTYINILPVFFLLTFIFLNAFRCYRQLGFKRYRSVVRQTGLACLFEGMSFFAFLTLYHPLMFYAGITILFLPFLWLLLMANRVFMTRIVSSAQQQSNFVKYLLVIGTSPTALNAADVIDKNPDLGIRLVGFVSDAHNALKRHYGGISVLGTIKGLDEVLDHRIVDCVLYTGGIEDPEQLNQIVRSCEVRGIDFAYTNSLLDSRFKEVEVEQFEDIPVVVCRTVAHNPMKLFVKRCLDVVASSILIVLCIPLWIVVPILIKRSSPGPVLFKQERVGKHGRRFVMYKFRSMIVGAEEMQKNLVHLNEMQGPVFKIQDDPRFTSIGSLLRRTSIDELPQLFNVLKGDMSLVGPRPPLFKEVVHYSPWFKKRLAVIPGITCLWQVTGRSTIRFDEWMHLDLKYIENWSLMLDFKILLRTVHAVLSRKGAQ